MTADLAGATRREVVLDSAPTLGGLYVRAATSSGRAAVTGPLRRAGHRAGRRLRPGARAALGRDSPVAAGPTLPAVTYRLAGVRPDPDRLTAYQHLVREPAADVLPAGYVHVLAFPVAIALMVRPDFPMPPLGIVHLANRIEQHRPFGIGDTLEVRAWAERLRPHRRGAQVELVTEVRSATDDDGPAPWRGVSTYLAPRVRVPGVASAELDTPRPDFVAPTPTGRWVLPADAGRRYAAVSGDANPIHLSSLSARALGFPRAIAHGMDTAARALADVGARRGEAYAWEVEFASPVLLPSDPAVRVAPDGGGGWGVTVWDAQRGKLHLTAAVRAIG